MPYEDLNDAEIQVLDALGTFDGDHTTADGVKSRLGTEDSVTAPLNKLVKEGFADKDDDGHFFITGAGRQARMGR